MKASKNNSDNTILPGKGYKPGEKIIFCFNPDFIGTIYEGTFYQHIGIPFPHLRLYQQEECGIKYKQPKYGYRLGGYGYSWKEERVIYSQMMKAPEQVCLK